MKFDNCSAASESCMLLDKYFSLLDYDFLTYYRCCFRELEEMYENTSPKAPSRSARYYMYQRML